VDRVGLGVLSAVGVGALAGLFNGLVVTYIGIPALVVTIGTQFLFRGLALVLVNGRSTALVATTGSPAYDVMVGKLFGILWHRQSVKIDDAVKGLVLVL